MLFESIQLCCSYAPASPPAEALDRNCGSVGSGANATKGAGLRLLPARPEDAEALRDGAVESFRKDFEAYGAKPPQIEVVDFHARNIAGGHYYKILCDVGLAGAILVEPKTANTAEIALFFIVPAYQNRGIGGGALALIEARYRSIAIWQLVTPSAEPRNRHFYERHGYRRTGTITSSAGPGPTVTKYEKRV